MKFEDFDLNDPISDTKPKVMQFEGIDINDPLDSVVPQKPTSIGANVVPEQSFVNNQGTTEVIPEWKRSSGTIGDITRAAIASGIEQLGGGIGYLAALPGQGIEKIPGMEPIGKAIAVPGELLREQATESGKKIRASMTPQTQQELASPVFTPEAETAFEKTFQGIKSFDTGAITEGAKEFVSGKIISPEATLKQVYMNMVEQWPYLLAAGKANKVLQGASKLVKILGQSTVGALMAGTQNAQQAYDQTNSLPEEKLRESPEYNKLLDEGNLPADAKRKLANSIAHETFLRTAPLGGLAGGLEFGGLFKGKWPTRMLKGAIAGVPEETLDEALEQWQTNLATQRADIRQKETAGVLTSGVLGGIMGLGFGAYGATGQSNAVTTKQSLKNINDTDPNIRLEALKHVLSNIEDPEIHKAWAEYGLDAITQAKPININEDFAKGKPVSAKDIADEGLPPVDLPKKPPPPPPPPPPPGSAPIADEGIAGRVAPVDLTKSVAGEPAKTETPPAKEATVPVMITKLMKRRLSNLGYDDADISKLIPAEAHHILNNKIAKPIEQKGGEVVGEQGQETKAAGQEGLVTGAEGISVTGGQAETSGTAEQIKPPLPSAGTEAVVSSSAPSGTPTPVAPSPDLEELRRMNPILFRQAQRAKSVDAFINKMSEGKPDTVDRQVLEDFYKRVNKIESQLPVTPETKFSPKAKSEAIIKLKAQIKELAKEGTGTNRYKAAIEKLAEMEKAGKPKATITPEPAPSEPASKVEAKAEPSRSRTKEVIQSDIDAILKKSDKGQVTEADIDRMVELRAELRGVGKTQDTTVKTRATKSEAPARVKNIHSLENEMKAEGATEKTITLSELQALREYPLKNIKNKKTGKMEISGEFPVRQHLINLLRKKGITVVDNKGKAISEWHQRYERTTKRKHEIIKEALDDGHTEREINIVTEKGISDGENEGADESVKEEEIENAVDEIAKKINVKSPISGGLWRWVNKKGGMRIGNMTGEIREVLENNPQARMMKRKDGKWGIDQLVKMAHDEGLIPDVEPQTFLDALGNQNWRSPEAHENVDYAKKFKESEQKKEAESEPAYTFLTAQEAEKTKAAKPTQSNMFGVAGDESLNKPVQAKETPQTELEKGIEAEKTRKAQEGQEGDNLFSAKPATTFKGLQKSDVESLFGDKLKGIVEFHQDETTLPSDMQGMVKLMSEDKIGKDGKVEKGEIVEGYYDKATGIIHIIAGNVPNAFRLQEVLKHELTHRGEKSTLNSMFGKPTELMIGRIRTKYGNEIEGMRQKGWSDEKAFSEWLARIGEGYNDLPMLRRLFANMRNTLRKIGFDIEFSTSDIRNLVGRMTEAGKGEGKALTSQSESAEALFSVNDTKRELINMGVVIDDGIVTLYRGGNVSENKLRKLRYGDYLSTVREGKDAQGNSGASEYGKNIVEIRLPVKNIQVVNGEVQYKGGSASLKGKKYPIEIYRAFNDVYGSNYTAKEIDAMEYKEVRSVARQGLGDGVEEFDRLVPRNPNMLFSTRKAEGYDNFAKFFEERKGELEATGKEQGNINPRTLFEKNYADLNDEERRFVDNAMGDTLFSTRKRTDDLTASIQNAKQQGQSFDEWAKGQGESKFFHGSATGEFGDKEIHIGTKEAAKQALESRIGIPADGKGWDGTKTYGETLLAGKKTLRKLDPRGYNETGFNIDVPETDFYLKDRTDLATATFGDGTKIPLTVKPNLFGVNIKGEMTNLPASAMSDAKANATIKAMLKKGTAKRGYYYTNIGEDEGSISAVVPSKAHLLTRSQLKAEWDRVVGEDDTLFSTRKADKAISKIVDDAVIQNAFASIAGPSSLAGGVLTGIQRSFVPGSLSQKALDAVNEGRKILGESKRFIGGASRRLENFRKFMDKQGIDDPKLSFDKNLGFQVQDIISKTLITDIVRGHIPLLESLTNTTPETKAKIKEYIQNRQVIFDKLIDDVRSLETGALETIRKAYYQGVYTKESIRAYEQALNEAFEQGIGDKGTPLSQWTAEQRKWVLDRTNTIEKSGGGVEGDIGLSYLSKSTMEGKKAFLKEKTFEDISTAMSFGLKPISANPAVLDILKATEMRRYIDAHKFRQALERIGLSQYVSVFKQAPDGWLKSTDPMFTKYGPKPEEGMPVFPVIGHWYFDPAAHQVVENYLSQSLYNSPYVGNLFKTWMKAANVLNQSQLWGFFHAGFIHAESSLLAISNVISDAYKFAQGNITGRELLRTMKAVPLTAAGLYYKKGSEIMRAYYDPNNTSSQAIKDVAKAFELSGMQGRMDDIYRTDYTSKMYAQWHGGQKLKALGKSYFAFIEAMARPIMDNLVPKAKFAAFGEYATRIMRDNPMPAGMDREAWLDSLQPKFAKAANSIEATMGQVAYDRLFMRNAWKNATQALIRAPGWSGGTLVQILGGFKDTGNFLKEWKNTGKMPSELPPRAAYVISLMVTTALLNGFLTALFTGDDPEDMDFWAFRTGGIDEKGKPERMLMPTYAKDVYAYMNAPMRTLGHKTHPLLSVLNDIVLNNKDYYGVEIRHKGDNPIQQMSDLAQFGIKQFTPFWMRGTAKEAERGGGLAETLAKAPQKIVAPFFGVMPASREYTRSKAEKVIDEIYSHRAKGTQTKEEFEKTQLRHQLRRGLMLGTPTAREDIIAAVREGNITHQQAMNIRKSSRVDSLQLEFAHLTLEQAMEVWDVATAEEKAKIRRPFRLKWRNSVKNLTSVERNKLRPEVMARLHDNE